MPTLTLLAVPSPLLSAALALAAPQSAAPQVIPLQWSLHAAQDAASLPQDESLPPPDGETADGAPINEIVVEGSYGPPESDPLEQINEDSYRITQAVDQALVEPIAYAYRDELPEPIRDGLGNVVRNLAEPSNALNFLLQGKVGKAFETLGRLAINTTVGVGGLFDVAGKKAKLPYRRNGFANTMGVYGVGPGPYVFMPLVGATSLRDFIGNALDQALLPYAIGKPFRGPEFAASYFVVNALDRRLALDAELVEIQSSDDPYVMRRETYLAKRARDIAALKGEAVPEEQDLSPEDRLPPQSSLTLPERLGITAGLSAPEGR